jgi:hypothetical protein
MTQRTLTSTSLLRPAAPAARRHDQRWLSLGEAVSAVVDALFSPSPGGLPPESLRDRDPALHRALMQAGVDRERERLAANRPPLLY